MTPYTAQRHRFGILAARHMLERWRMTDRQVDDLEGCKGSGWMVKDSQKAFDREHKAATMRRENQHQEKLDDLARRKAALRKLFGKECPDD